MKKAQRKKYNELLAELKPLFEVERHSAQQVANETKVANYWEAGKKLWQERSVSTSEEEQQLVHDLASDLQVERSLFYRIMQFYESWKRGVPHFSKTLSWSHYREVLALEPAVQRFYLEAAAEKSWSQPTLGKAIREKFHETRSEKSPQKLKRDTRLLHVYKAVVEKVVDGDTLLARVDLGFDIWTQQRLRLRGVNCPERKGAKAELSAKACAFLEEKLKGLEFVVLRSYKSDVYGRYVVDLFYHPVLKKKEQVFAEGFFLNEELLGAGLAELEL